MPGLIGAAARRLPASLWQEANGAAFPHVEPLLFNEGLAPDLGLDPDMAVTKDGLGLLSGNSAAGGQSPIALAYAGHQFGHFVPLLGDGRAHLVASIEDPAGRIHDLHLKGSGRTPYSRGTSDGRATLGAALREYIVSEAMAALGVPTTRGLAVIGTGETVERETPLPGAIIARTARSLIRVGTFQFAATLDDAAVLTALADAVIDRMGYDLPASGPDRYEALLRETATAQATLIARWMSLGFIHGVMNTDNMSLAGETIDYGPCAFIDTFAPDKVFSAIDRGGRYAWNQQAEIGAWSLARLAEAMLPLLGDDEETAIETAQGVLTGYGETFGTTFQALMRRKLGLANTAESSAFLGEAFTALTEGEADFTAFFTGLTRHADGGDPEPVRQAFGDADRAGRFLQDWEQVALPIDAERRAAMKAANPVRIPRNHQVEAAIRAAEDHGDLQPSRALMEALAHPYREDQRFEAYEAPPGPGEEVTRTFCGT